MVGTMVGLVRSAVGSVDAVRTMVGRVRSVVSMVGTVVRSWWVFDGYLKFFAKGRRCLSSCLISDRFKVFEGVEKEELAEGRHYARVAGPNAVDAGFWTGQWAVRGGM